MTRHVQRLRGIYTRRRQSLLPFLREELGEWLDPVLSFYGMHIAAVPRRPMDLEPVTGDLLEAQVKIHTLSRYGLGSLTRQGLILGYGAVDLAQARPVRPAQGIAALRRRLKLNSSRSARRETFP